MKILETVTQIGETSQRKVWTSPLIIEGDASFTEGGVANAPETVAGIASSS